MSTAARAIACTATGAHSSLVALVLASSGATCYSCDMLKHPDPKEHLRQRGWVDTLSEHGVMWGREEDDASVLLDDDGTMQFFGHVSVYTSDVYALALIAAGAGQGDVADKPKTVINLSDAGDFYLWKETVKQVLANGHRMQQAIDEADMFIAAMHERCKSEDA